MEYSLQDFTIKERLGKAGSGKPKLHIENFANNNLRN
jgi:hypothetical protein